MEGEAEGRSRSGPGPSELIRGFLKADPDAFLFSPADAITEHNARRSAGRKSKPTPSELARRAGTPDSQNHRRYGRSSYRNAILRACDRAFPHPEIRKARGKSLTDAEMLELKAWREAHRWHPNQLRHSTATSIRSRYGLEAAQVVLGHSKADVTEVYAERDLAKAREVMREIG